MLINFRDRTRQLYGEAKNASTEMAPLGNGEDEKNQRRAGADKGTEGGAGNNLV